MPLVLYPADDNLHDSPLPAEGPFTLPILLLLQRTKSLELGKNILDHSLPRDLLESQVLLRFTRIDSISSLINWCLLILSNFWDGSV
jgi:hypothetical protein